MKKFLVAMVFVFLLGCGGVAYWAYQDLHTPVYHAKSGQYVDVPRGSTPSAVVKKLANEGIIKHEWPLLIYVKLSGAGSRLKAGEYKFPSPLTPLALLRRLEQGEQRLIRLTIIEGWTRWDIANAMTKVPEFGMQDPNDALVLMNDVSEISSLDSQATNLEGYMYPDTYDFPPTTTPKAVINMMVKRFLTVWTECDGKPHTAKLTTREVVTTASLIETEAKLQSERPLVASVIYNRLKRNIPLGIDSTIVYASKLAGKWRNDGKVYKSDVDRVSPYNTRLRAGLPPGPIAAPGLSCLEAALNPAETDYLYYVREPSRNDGAHNFYANEQDFNRGVQALRNWERQRDARETTPRN
jgi:UPF0755 protein